MKIGDLVIPQDQQEWEREEKGLGVIIDTKNTGAMVVYKVCWTKGNYGTFWDVEGELEIVCEA